MDSNCTGEMCWCVEVGLFHPDQKPAPTTLILASLVHIFLVAILGTFCNGVAIWCVTTCKKTRTAVKVLLCSVFVPLLLICLVTRSMRVEAALAFIYCDPDRATKTFLVITSLIYSFLAQMELVCIAALAIVRTVAVWSPSRHTLRLRVAVILVISLLIYSFFSGVGIPGALKMGYIHNERLQDVVTIIYFFTNVMLPFLVTATTYALMMIAMRRNRQRLAACDSRTSSAGVMDQATQAVAAVFISNLVFGLPHAVYHLLGDASHNLKIIFHMLFSTHFVMDPLVFIWYNRNYRHSVRQQMGTVWRLVVGCCRSVTHKRSFTKASSTLQFCASTHSADINSTSWESPKELHVAGVITRV